MLALGTVEVEFETESRFQRDLAIARRQGVTSLELRATVSLGHPWQKKAGKRKPASYWRPATVGSARASPRMTCRRPGHCLRNYRLNPPCTSSGGRKPQPWVAPCDPGRKPIRTGAASARRSRGTCNPSFEWDRHLVYFVHGLSSLRVVAHHATKEELYVSSQ